MAAVADTEAARPLLRVVRGTPEDVELAALTAVVATLASSADEKEQPKRRSLWSAPLTSLRTPLYPGPGAWKASALTR